MAREAGGASLDKAVFFLHLGRARECLRAGRLEEARRELELASLAHPDDVELLNLVSIVEFRRGDFAEAARATSLLLAANPDSAVLHANLGVIQFKAGVLADAERELARAVELDPGHARGHLYLGLLRRRRGELGPALDHLRRAGAKKAAAEVEEALERSSRMAPLAAVPRPAEEPVVSRAAGDAARGPADRPLFEVVENGTLRVASRGLVYVRKATVSWYSGRIRFVEEPAFAGTKLASLLRAEGEGDLLLRDSGRRPVSRETATSPLFLEAGRLLALSAGLRYRLDPIQDFSSRRRVEVLKIQGRGEAVLSIVGTLEPHDVSEGFPLSVSSRDLVAWTGDLLPSVLEDRFLDEVMTPDPANAPKLRFEGEGVVLTESPSS